MSAPIDRRDDVNPTEGEHTFGDVEVADPTTINTYPIDTPEHVRAAWSSINHKDSAAKDDADEVKAIKDRIKRAAKHHDVEIDAACAERRRAGERGGVAAAAVGDPRRGMVRSARSPGAGRRVGRTSRRMDLMRPLHERFLEAVAEERARLRSRRALLADGAKLAGGGALALLATGVAPGGIRLARAQDFADDLDILGYALTLEQLEFAFYRDGLEAFSDADFAGANVEATDGTGDATPDASPVADDVEVPLPSRARLEQIRDHEAAHVQALTDTIVQLGGSPVAEGEYDFGEAFDDLANFLATAQALENTGVAAYAGAAPFIADDAILAAALGIHSVEARHAAYLNELNGESPFPEAVDASLTRAQVLEAAGGFIVFQATPVPAAPAVDPTLDSDNDAISDEEEIAIGTDPNNPDTDGDGLVDVDERNVYDTDATLFDTDGDGVGDGDEITNGTNPFDPASL